MNGEGPAPVNGDDPAPVNGDGPAPVNGDGPAPPPGQALNRGLRSRLGRRPPRMRVVPLNVLIPNLLTLLSLCAGMTAVRFALQGEWESSALALTAAAVLDTLDGRIARLLKGSTKMGAELDSLADMVCFGAAPAVVMHLWSLSNVPRFGWIVSLLFACCCALRLARFNSLLDDPDKPAWTAHFFSGAPAPAAAGIAVWPLILSFITPWEWLREPLFAGSVMLVSAMLMVSRVPMFSFKRIRLTGAQAPLVMIAAAAAFACLISAPWWTLTAVLGAYIASIPYAVLTHRRHRLKSASAGH